MNSTSRFRMISSKSNNNMILDHSKLCLSLKLPESSFEEVNLNGGDSNKTPVNESPERYVNKFSFKFSRNIYLKENISMIAFAFDNLRFL